MALLKDSDHPHNGLSTYKSAITEADGKAVNVWYVTVWWSTVTLLPVIPIMVSGAVWMAWTSPTHEFPFALLGAGVGTVIAAAGAAWTAVAAAMRGQAGQQP